MNSGKINKHRRQRIACIISLLSIALIALNEVSPAQSWQLITRLGHFDHSAFQMGTEKVLGLTNTSLLYLSVDSGIRFLPLAMPPLPDENPIAVIADDASFYCGYNINNTNRYFRTTDDGAAWSELPLSGVGNTDNLDYYPQIRALLTSTHRSNDHGFTWTPIWPDTISHEFKTPVFSSRQGEYYLCELKPKRIVKTTDDGASWRPLDTAGLAGAMPDAHLAAVSPYNPNLLFLCRSYATMPQYMYRSEDGGKSWGLVIPSAFSPDTSMTLESFAFMDASIMYLSVEIWFAKTRVLFKSTDAGLSWVRTTTPEAATFIWAHDSVLYSYNNQTGNVFMTTDPIVNSWTLWHHFDARVEAFQYLNGGIIFAGPRYLSPDAGASWLELRTSSSGIPTASPLHLIPSNPTMLLLDYRCSTDGGATWYDWMNDSTYAILGFLAADPIGTRKFFVSAGSPSGVGATVLRTDDGGVTYQQTGFPYFNKMVISESDPRVMIGMHYFAVWTVHWGWDFYNTTDGGATWGTNLLFAPVRDSSQTTRPPTVPDGYDVHFIAIHPRSADEMYHDDVFDISTSIGDHWWGSYLKKTRTGAAAGWTAIEQPRYNTPIRGMNFSPTNGDSIVADYGRISISSDSGWHWTEIISPTFDLVEVDWPNRIIYGANTQGIQATTDFGSTWRWLNNGLSCTRVRSIVRDRNGDLYCVTDDGVYKKPPGLATSETSSTAPLRCALGQNYPNPFSGSTTIPFELSEKGEVSITVFDVLGKKIATVLSEELPPGKYYRTWSGAGVSDGMYFYRFSSRRYMETKRFFIAHH